MKKPKMVKCWAWSIDDKDGSYWIQSVNSKCTKADAALVRSHYTETRPRFVCGPIVRIEVPAPRSEKWATCKPKDSTTQTR